MKKKHSPIMKEAADPASVSVLSTPSPAEVQNRPKASYVPPVYPYTPSRTERREYVHAKVKGVPVWINEPEWVKRRKANHERTNSQSTSAISSPQRPRLSLPGRALSPTVHPFTPFTQIPPPPKLQPLLFTDPRNSLPNSTDAAHAAWWARISNNLASHSARSYHLFVASSFLTCKTEELLLLYEVRKLNADGKMLFEEVLRGLRVRIANWEGSIDELRISWDMTSKLEMVGRYDAFVAAQVARLERELRGDAGASYGDGGDDDSETVVNSRPWQDDCAVEDSSCENYPTEISQPSEFEASGDEGEKTVIFEPEERKDCTPADRSLTRHSSFDWADDANEAFQDEGKDSVKGHKGQDDSTILKPAVTGPLVDAAIPSPIDITPPTWAKVLASPVKVQADGSGPVKNGDDLSLEDWGDVSGEAWTWERNWK